MNRSDKYRLQNTGTTLSMTALWSIHFAGDLQRWRPHDDRRQWQCAAATNMTMSLYIHCCIAHPLGRPLCQHKVTWLWQWKEKKTGTNKHNCHTFTVQNHHNMSSLFLGTVVYDKSIGSLSMDIMKEMPIILFTSRMLCIEIPYHVQCVQLNKLININKNTSIVMQYNTQTEEICL